MISKTTKVNLSKFEVPKEVISVTETLKKADFEAYIVGGCTRDLFLGNKPKDWDITTNATPEQIQSLFPKTFYENEYGTVGVVNEVPHLGEGDCSDETLRIVEVTPYRLEAKYGDFRRPDFVKWSKSLEDDLKRRDFTVNAIALDVNEKGTILNIVDLFGGRKDLEKKIIKAIGNADERFKEDALRTLRAIRLSSELNFEIDTDTENSIKTDAYLLDKIAKERIRDEFEKILMSERPMYGLLLAYKLGVLKYIVPELEMCIGVKQNQAHLYDVFEHLLKSLQHGADKNFSLDVRVAAIFHDIGKPKTRLWSEEKKDWTFHGHDMVSAKMTKKILENLHFPSKTIDKICKISRWHMFFSDTEVITLSAVRRLIRNVGQENIWELMDIRACDRIGTGVPKESPYRLRKYRSMIEEALRDPISVGMLKIDGIKIMEITKLSAGPKIGFILHALLEEVLNDPKFNTEEYLKNKAIELSKLSEKELREIGEKGKEKKEELEKQEVEKLRTKHFVK